MVRVQGCVVRCRGGGGTEGRGGESLEVVGFRRLRFHVSAFYSFARVLGSSQSPNTRSDV